jgi:hypothetical protein
MVKENYLENVCWLERQRRCAKTDSPVQMIRIIFFFRIACIPAHP